MQRLSLISGLVKLGRTLQRRPAVAWRPLGPRSFSTETDDQASPIDPFLRPPRTGLTYGRFTGSSRLAMKTDVIHFFDGCNLTLEDIRFNYNKAYEQLGMIIQFPSRSSFDNATRLIARNGRFYKLEKVDRGQWDSLTSYDGKTVLLHGIPRSATFEDIERFLSGCDYVGSNIQVALRPGFPEPLKIALVQFHSQTEAATAVRSHGIRELFSNCNPWRVIQLEKLFATDES